MRIPALATLLLTLLQGGAILLAPTPARAALADLDDSAMEQVSGAGIAIALDDFEFAMAPTSYFEQVGTAPTDIADTLPGDLCAGTGSVASNTDCWRRGDLRWYGINISAASGTSDGFHWNDSTACSSSSLNCPRGGVIDNFSPFDNPYTIRAWSPVGIASDGTCVNGITGSCTTPGAPTSKAIYEFLAPTSQPNYTFSWWGEMEVGSTRNSQTEVLNSGTRTGLLKSQNIIRGNAAGSIFRMFNAGTAANPTFGLFYHSYLRGDYRFSVAQAVINNTIGEAPVFADTEGMYFRNVNAFIPVGQLYYQALTIKAIDTSGNFELALTPLPAGTGAGDIAVQNKHYGLRTGAFSGTVTGNNYLADTQGYETARANNNGDIAASTDAAFDNYKLTHGYARWGTWNANGSYNSNAIASDIEGIIFKGCTGCTAFRAFAESPNVIDKRGTHFSRQEVRNYNCTTGNEGGCSVIAGGGPITTGDFNGTLTDNCDAYGGDHDCYTHNGRDPDPGENEWDLIGCGGTCPLGIPTPAGDRTKSFPTQTVNLGETRIEGLMIQTLRIQSCGGVPAC